MNTLESTRSYNGLFSAFLIGISDGLIVPFALTTGLAAAAMDLSVILPVGGYAVIPGAVAMAISGYTAGKAAERAGLGSNRYPPVPNKMESREFFAHIGLNKEMQDRALKEIANDEEKWQELLVSRAAQLHQIGAQRPAGTALTIGLSYALGGLIPLSPYLLINAPPQALKFSLTITPVVLFILGFVKNRFLGLNPLGGAVRLTIAGVAAAGVAFMVARLVTQG